MMRRMNLATIGSRALGAALVLAPSNRRVIASAIAYEEYFQKARAVGARADRATQVLAEVRAEHQRSYLDFDLYAEAWQRLICELCEFPSSASPA